MATITTHTCDICKATAVHLNFKTPVVFMTEQTEGRPSKPYLTTATIDLCDACHKRIVESSPLVAYGAQGHNTYEWRK